MRYLPHTDEDIAQMVQAIGVRDLEDLYVTVPDACRRSRPLSLADPVSEWELNEHMGNLSASMAVSPRYKVFVGAGSYEHFIPETVRQLLSRSEFVTAYTPYQPELSQGTLQAIYEYQTLVARLLGMETANASLYDGGSAFAEALLMAIRVTRGNKIAMSRLVHPFYRKVAQTYLASGDYELVELPYSDNGTTDLSGLDQIEGLAAVAVQSPNFFGIIEDLQKISEAAHRREALSVVAFSEPLAYGLLKNPGSLGADIACGEGQSFGIPQSFGGPGVGMFASKMKYVRSMPGRLVGLGKDVEGKRGFVLTLATREQHIRREKATSNICTNGSLCALAAVMYMASVGGTGFRELARLNYDKSEYLKSELRKTGCKLPFAAPTFNEFVAELPSGSESVRERLLGEGIVAGLPLAQFYPEMENHYLLCVTETKTRADMDALVREFSS